MGRGNGLGYTLCLAHLRVKLQDPLACDLKEYELDVLRRKRYSMGCTSDIVEIRSRDTAEALVQSILQQP